MRRRIVMLVLLLTGGAIVNVAVAWGLSFDRGPYDLIDPEPSNFYSNGTFDLDTRRFWGGILHARPGRHAVEIIVSSELDEMMETEQATDAEIAALVKEAGLEELPSWSAVRSSRLVAAARIGEFEHHQLISDRAFGWPFLAMTCYWYLRIDEDARMYRRDVRWGQAITAPDTAIRPQPSMSWFLQLDNPWILPLRTLFPGFIFNTLFYALLLWLIFLAPFAARRMIRRLRGRCAGCAYPIGFSDICTECGAAVSRRRSADA